MSIRVGLRYMGRVLGKVPCPVIRKTVNIFSTYSLCTLPIEELTAQPTSTYALCIAQEESLTASPDSTYSLSTAPT